MTIPKKLRDRLGLRAGEVLEFREEAGTLIATKAPSADAVESVYGILDLDQTTDALIAAMRGAPDTV